MLYEAETRRQEVRDGLNRAAELQAESRWKEARVVLERTRTHLGTNPPADLLLRVEEAITTLDLVDRLNATRLKLFASLVGTSEQDLADKEYAAIFQEAGLAKEGDDPAAVAVRVKQSPVREELIAALDVWASVTKDENRRKWVQAATRQADPNTKRDLMRSTWSWKDRGELQRWLDATDPAEVPPALADVVGLKVLSLGVSPVNLLTGVHRRHPDDFRVALMLGVALGDEGRYDEALPPLRVAVALRPGVAAVHLSLGTSLMGLGQLDESVEEYRKAVSLDPKSGLARVALGLGLTDLGRYPEAREEFRLAKEQLASENPLHRTATGGHIVCEKMIALESKLPDIISGGTRPADNQEREFLAQICHRQKRFAIAARLSAEVITSQQDLDKDVSSYLRFEAGRAAAQAGCGRGEDASLLDEMERARLRREALDWLKAELAVREKAAGLREDARKIARIRLRRLQSDPALAVVRDPEALEKLPESERKLWWRFWGDVAVAIRKLAEPK